MRIVRASKIATKTNPDKRYGCPLRSRYLYRCCPIVLPFVCSARRHRFYPCRSVVLLPPTASSPQSPPSKGARFTTQNHAGTISVLCGVCFEAIMYLHDQVVGLHSACAPAYASLLRHPPPPRTPPPSPPAGTTPEQPEHTAVPARRHTPTHGALVQDLCTPHNAHLLLSLIELCALRARKLT